MYQLRLISTSPRRRDLLSEAGYVFTVCSLNLSEQLNKKLSLEASVMDLARRKVQCHLNEVKCVKRHKIVALGADTIVSLEGRVLNKPKNFEDAAASLSLMSGKTHSVITGVSIYSFNHQQFFDFYDVTEVSFRELTKGEIRTYVSTGEPMDKAGSYAIQGLGSDFVKKISGSWTNVVGLPMEKLNQILNRRGIGIEMRQGKSELKGISES